MLWTGEFGRLPVSQGTDGRDHNRHAFSLWLAGGGFRPGYTHGATDEFGYKSVEKVVTVHDLQATLFDALGNSLQSGQAISAFTCSYCRNRLHFVPFGLIILWIALFAPLFIDKPYYWGGVTFQNRSAAEIWVENEGLLNSGKSEGSQQRFNGEDWGNSPDSITVVWWYGSSRFPPFDKSQINRMVLGPPANLPRRTHLSVTIDENGEWSIDEWSPLKKNQSGPGASKLIYPRD